MTKRIKLELTYDQARAVYTALQNDLQYDGDEDEPTLEY